MFWLFKRKPLTAWDEYERNLVAQGLPAKQVRRAANLVKQLSKAGVLPLDPETGLPRSGALKGHLINPPEGVAFYPKTKERDG
jgi:hypothetical protein